MSRTPARFAFLGGLLSLGAPGGWLIVQALSGTPIAESLAAEPDLYGYLLFSTALVFSVTGWFLGRQWEDLQEANDRLTRLSGEDELTGLPNVRAFWRDLRRALAEANRADDNYDVHLLLVDLDHFKSVNDTYGHPEGDRVLQAVTEVMIAVLRESEGAFRVGGEEFAVILRGTDLTGALGAAERLRAAVERLRVPVVNLSGEDVLLQVTISLGMASDRGQGAEELYREADEALYKAKRAGRNRVARAAVEMLVVGPAA